MTINVHELNDLDDHIWDVVVVGAGMGGAGATRYLVEAGLDVLLIEKGRAGITVESSRHETVPDERLNIGYWPTQMRTQIDGKTLDAWPVIGCGFGGSSLHYGATLQRFEPSDFDLWPISYAELEPFYQQAETIFNVHGSADPLSKISEESYGLKRPHPMGEYDQSLFDAFKETGLHPYRLHLALRSPANCSSCENNHCNLSCRLDANEACIEPIIQYENITILHETDVVELRNSGSSIESVVAESNGDRRCIRAKQFILAAGALSTPKLLLQSRSKDFPNGVGNRHSIVGRNLMFHASDFIAVWPKRRRRPDGMQKAMAFRDFYEVDGTKYGEVQSMGFPTSPGDILQFLHIKFSRSPFRHIPLLRHALRIPAFIGSKLFREAAVYSTIVQDLPYEENCVLLDDSAPGGVCVKYNIRPELTNRIESLRKLLKSKLSSLRTFRLNQDISLNLGHPCGTCRAGKSAEGSVVDADFKVHDTDNLYIADGSIFATSGGTNPSLTIAACALRCASNVVDSHKAAKP